MEESELIYPFILQCCNHTENSFWEKIFKDLAYNITPKGFYINKNYLYYNDNKTDRYKLEKKDSKILYYELYNLLKDKIDIFEEDAEDEIKLETKNWDNIKKKYFKDMLIEKYVIDMRAKYNLNIKQTKNLLSLIYICFLFKVIKKEDIIYKDNKICDIKNIIISRKEVKTRTNIYDYSIDNINKNNYTEKEKVNISGNWDKFIKDLKKK